MSKPLVSIVMGSDSDRDVMSKAAVILEQFNIDSEIVIASAHRSPRFTEEYARTAVERGVDVIIAGAGMAAHLAGVIAANTNLPVIGVPLDASSLGGIDSLLSMTQMPGGVPVATMGIGSAGAKNAAFFALRILSLKLPDLKQQLDEYVEAMEEEIRSKSTLKAK